MASRYYFFTGECKWAKLDSPDEKYGKYSIDVYLDKPSLEKYHESGLTLKVKDDEDGTFVKFKRDPEKLLDDMEEKPKKLQFNDETKEYDPYDNERGKIGNGSLVTVKVCVYDTQRGPGHRLEAVAVENLVPYEGGDQDLPF